MGVAIPFDQSQTNGFNFLICPVIGSHGVQSLRLRHGVHRAFATIWSNHCGCADGTPIFSPKPHANLVCISVKCYEKRSGLKEVGVGGARAWNGTTRWSSTEAAGMFCGNADGTTLGTQCRCAGSGGASSCAHSGQSKVWATQGASPSSLLASSLIAPMSLQTMVKP